MICAGKVYLQYPLEKYGNYFRFLSITFVREFHGSGNGWYSKRCGQVLFFLCSVICADFKAKLFRVDFLSISYVAKLQVSGIHCGSRVTRVLLLKWDSVICAVDILLAISSCVITATLCRSDLLQCIFFGGIKRD